MVQRSSLVGLSLLSLVLSGCLDASVTFPITREVAFSSSDLPVDPAYQAVDASGVVVASFPCSSTSECPMAPEINVACNASGVCDPVATSATIAAQDIDLREVMDRFTIVDSISLRGVEYAVVTNTFNVALPVVDVYWAPVGTASVSDAFRLGSFPVVGAGATPMARVPLDVVGTAALNDHLAGVSHQFRLFLETTVDLDPGDPFPQGALTANVQFEVRATGRLR